jgi:hypothetical protein
MPFFSSAASTPQKDPLQVAIENAKSVISKVEAANRAAGTKVASRVTCLRWKRSNLAVSRGARVAKRCAERLFCSRSMQTLTSCGSG